ncbi:MAG TPA: glutathione transferase GstA [Polyangiaceae bacterium]|nr:glutathione transferase GstA [Polyangiaceae bacterium]
MKLYYSPGTCSLATHIALLEAGLPFELERVDFASKRTEKGTDYLAINPKGYVPSLQLDSGEILTEAQVILQYIAEAKPEARLAPTGSTVARFRVLEMLNFISTELHKQFGPLFRPNTPKETADFQVELIGKRIAWLEPRLAGSSYVASDAFGIADMYLFTILNWALRLKMDLSQWPNVRAYMGRIAERPSALAAMRREGLIPA